MADIGLFYGSDTGNTEYVAYLIKDALETLLGPDTVDVHNIGKSGLAAMRDYPRLILGIPTWNIGQLQDDWDVLWPDLEELDFAGKTVALFGLGDQYGYPDTFLDALGMLGEKVLDQGAALVGYWPAAGYEFEQSLAFEPASDRLMGLGIDEDHQPERTGDRVDAWAAQIVGEFGLIAKPAVA